MPRKTLQPPELFQSKPWGFSQVVIAPPGRIVSIAGQVPWDSKSRPVGGDRWEQMRRCFQNVFVAVRAAGGTPDDVVSLRLYMVNFRSEEAETVADVLKETFGDRDPPASTWIGVTCLARPEYMIEVEALAVVP
jgi:enamine deaminase RidA (YjgF/YER057c/UK114 family)